MNCHSQNFAKQMTKDHMKEDILPIFSQLASDEQDSVRLLVVECCVALASMLTQEENYTLVLPIARNCSQDKSWRVRYMVADQFCQVDIETKCNPISESLLL